MGKIILLLLTSLLVARESPGYWFLTYWPSARSTAMGTWLTAIGDAPYSCYSNPAGLAISPKDLGVTYGLWLPGLLPGIYYNSLGGVYRLSGDRGVGVWLSYFDLGVTELTDPSGEKVRSYRNYQLALSIGYGERLTQKLMLGGALKLISSHLYDILVRPLWWDPYPDEGEGRGWAIDAGLLYEFTPSIALGGLFQNLGPSISTESDESIPLPRLFRLGLSCRPIDTEKIKFLITPELTKILLDMGYDPKDAWKGLGIELWLYKLIALRAGYFEDLTNCRGGWGCDQEGEFIRLPFTLGAGLHYKRFQFDLATDQLIYDLPTTDWKFTASYQF